MTHEILYETRHGVKGVDIGGVGIALKSYGNFFERYGGKSEVMKLKPNDREELFLRWKHGCKKKDDNEAVEDTDQYCLAMIRRCGIESIKNEGERHFWELEFKFDEKCQNIKKELGLMAIQPINPTIHRVDWDD